SEQAARRQSAVDAWATGTMRMMRRNEAQEKYAFQMATQAARERGMEEHKSTQDLTSGKFKISRSFYSSYRPSKADKERLIAALLKEGHSLKRTAQLSDSSSQEVAGVYLKIRDELKSSSSGNSANKGRTSARGANRVRASRRSSM
ncbi:MAG: hypothetical protein R3261_10045, partial [Alphaproteobacteria bacterium]|nr:hypothetical protein [Alphaproteobacteria bacterium]